MRALNISVALPMEYLGAVHALLESIYTSNTTGDGISSTSMPLQTLDLPL
jgi:hypothetical protein